MKPDWPLETERLLLRPYDDGDLDNLHAVYSRPDVARWLYYEASTLEQSREKLARKIAGRELSEEQALSAAVQLRDGTYVGDAVLFYLSVEHKTVEVGFSFDPRYQGKGYATEAARALVDWAFSRGFHRVIGRLEPRNTASARVLEKLGMRREAHLVENEWVKDEWQSELIYAILEHEWRSVQ
jgi:RimJ/RimL family protein N-acetyltransferase